MTSVVSALAGPLITGMMSDSGGGAVDAQVQGAGQASAAYRALAERAINEIYKQEGIARGDLDTYYTAGKREVSPFLLGGYSANDALLEQLGIPHPENSIAYLNLLDKKGAGDQYDADVKKKAELEKKLGDLVINNDRTAYARVNANSPYPYQSVAPAGKELLDYAKKQQGAFQGSAGAATPADLKQFWSGLAGSFGDMSQYDILGKDLGERPEGVTAEQQALLDRYEKGDFTGTGYNGYSTSKTAPLQKFLDSTPYQLLFGNGGKTGDATATAAERFQAGPGYQFAMDEGRKAVEAGAAARGGLLNGNTLAALTQYGQGVANQEFGNYQNRLSGVYSDYLNRVTGVSGVGANIASQGRAAANNMGGTLANLAMNTGNSVANVLTQQGSVEANSALAAGNARASGYLNEANRNNQMWGNVAENLGQASRGATQSGLSGLIQSFF